MSLLEELTNRRRPGLPQDQKLVEKLFAREEEDDEGFEMQESDPEDEQAFYPMPFNELYERETEMLIRKQVMRNQASKAFQYKNFERNRQAILQGEKADEKLGSF